MATKSHAPFMTIPLKEKPKEKFNIKIFIFIVIWIVLPPSDGSSIVLQPFLLNFFYKDAKITVKKYKSKMLPNMNNQFLTYSSIKIDLIISMGHGKSLNSD